MAAYDKADLERRMHGAVESLKGDLAGWWSRRLDQEHRLVYRVVDDALLIAQCRHHYDR